MSDTTPEQEQRDVKERIAGIEAHLQYVAKREDISNLKLWVIGLFVAAILVALGGGADELVKLFGGREPGSGSSSQEDSGKTG